MKKSLEMTIKILIIFNLKMMKNEDLLFKLSFFDNINNSEFQIDLDNYILSKFFFYKNKENNISFFETLDILFNEDFDNNFLEYNYDSKENENVDLINFNNPIIFKC